MYNSDVMRKRVAESLLIWWEVENSMQDMTLIAAAEVRHIMHFKSFYNSFMQVGLCNIVHLADI